MNDVDSDDFDDEGERDRDSNNSTEEQDDENEATNMPKTNNRQPYTKNSGSDPKETKLEGIKRVT